MLSIKTVGARQAAIRTRFAPVVASRAISIWSNVPQGPPVSKPSDYAPTCAGRRWSTHCTANKANCRM